jgi:hypothetical protein
LERARRDAFRLGRATDRLVLGENLSSQSDSTGLGSKVAELHDDTKTQRIRYTTKALDETLTEELLLPSLVKPNAWRYRGRTTLGLPFGVRLVSEIDRPDAEQKMGAAQAFAGLGGRLDLQQLGTDAGLPLDPAGQPTAQEREQQQAMMGMGQGQGPEQGPPGGKSGAKPVPDGIKKAIAAAREAGGERGEMAQHAAQMVGVSASSTAS